MAHMHYKGTGNMHSFRGLLGDGEQDRIRIQGATGEIAWRITKFELLTRIAGDSAYEHVVKIYREHQVPVTGTIDFTEDELLAAAYLEGNGANNVSDNLNVIFDNALFVRNIYVTHFDVDVGESVNYYIELEEVKISTAGMSQLAVAAARRTYVPGS